MTFDLQPTLQSDHLLVRPLTAEDQADLFNVACDPLIWEQHPAKERATAEGFAKFFAQSLATGGALLVSDRQTGAVIGSSRYFGYDETASEIEIGWTFLSRQYWGGKTNAELKKMMLEHAFQYVNSVVFLVAPENYRSQRAMEKIGGVRDGHRMSASGVYSLVFRIARSSDYCSTL